MNTYSGGLGRHAKMRMKKTPYLRDHDRALISISVPYPIWIISFQIRPECDTNHMGMCPSWSFRDLKQGTTERLKEELRGLLSWALRLKEELRDLVPLNVFRYGRIRCGSRTPDYPDTRLIYVPARTAPAPPRKCRDCEGHGQCK